MNRITELNESNYDEIFTLSQFAFQYVLSEEELQRKKEEAERHIIWGVKEDNKLAAKLHLIPLSVYVNGHPIAMGGISSVATWPEYRRGGMVRDLLSHALNVMKEKKMALSFLHPFSVPFYRQFGWEVAFARKHYDIPMSQFKQKFNGEGYVRRMDNAIPALTTIYHEYAKNFNGTLLRDEKWWKQRVLKDDQSIIAVAYNNEHEPEGYVIYQVKNRVMKIEELVYTSTNIWKVLLQFIANHDSMAERMEMIVPENDALPLLIQEPRFKQNIFPYFMARVVDVHSFLQQYFEKVQTDFTLQFQIHDDFMPENTGTYMIHKKHQELYIEHNSVIDEKGEAIQCQVQQLASMFLGYSRPSELYELGLIKGDVKEVEKLENLIARKQSYFLDFF